MTVVQVALRNIALHNAGHGFDLTLVGGSDALATDDADTSYVDIPNESLGAISSWAEGTFDAAAIPLDATVVLVQMVLRLRRTDVQTETVMLGALATSSPTAGYGTTFGIAGPGYDGLGEFFPAFGTAPAWQDASISALDSSLHGAGLTIADLNSGAITGIVSNGQFPQAVLGVTRVTRVLLSIDYALPVADRTPLRGRQRGSGVTGASPMRGRNNAPYGLRGRQESNR